MSNYDGTQEFSFMDIQDDEDVAALRGSDSDNSYDFDEEDKVYDPAAEEDDDGYDPEDPLGETKRGQDHEVVVNEVLNELANEFDEIDDNFQFTIQGEKVSKADLVEVVRTKNELKEAYQGISDYVANLSEVEMRVQTYLQASMTETETRLRQIEKMLDQPEKMTPTELQKAYIAQRDLRQRQAALEQNAQKVRAEEEQRRQSINMMKINQTDVQLRASVPGYQGMKTLREVAQWAQQNGLSEQSMLEAMSPEFVKILMDAKVYREKVSGKRGIAEKATARAPKSMSVKAKTTASVKSAMGHRKKTASFEKAMRDGDMSAAFNMLED